MNGPEDSRKELLEISLRNNLQAWPTTDGKVILHTILIEL